MTASVTTAESSLELGGAESTASSEGTAPATGKISRRVPPAGAMRPPGQMPIAPVKPLQPVPPPADGKH